MNSRTPRGSATNNNTTRYVEQPATPVEPLTAAQRSQLASLLVPAVGNLRQQHELIAYPVPLAARLIGIGPRRTWDLVRDGEIRSFNEGGRRLISRQALEEYVARPTRPDAPRPGVRQDEGDATIV